MGFRCSKGDLGQIKKGLWEPAEQGLWELMEFPALETWGQAFIGGGAEPSPGLTGG